MSTQTRARCAVGCKCAQRREVPGSTTYHLWTGLWGRARAHAQQACSSRYTTWYGVRALVACACSDARARAPAAKAGCVVGHACGTAGGNRMYPRFATTASHCSSYALRVQVRVSPRRLPACASRPACCAVCVTLRVEAPCPTRPPHFAAHNGWLRIVLPTTHVASPCPARRWTPACARSLRMASSLINVPSSCLWVCCAACLVCYDARRAANVLCTTPRTRVQVTAARIKWQRCTTC